MVIFTKEINGVIIEDADQVIQKIEVFNDDIQLTNRNKYNKYFIKKNKPTRANEKYCLEISKEDHDRKQKERKELSSLNKELMNDLKEETERKKKQKEETKKRKELNETKNITFQVIHDNKKIKKMNKKIRSQIIKMPAESFEKYLQKSKRNYE